MASYCLKCGGTGFVINNKFCTCVQGKLVARMEAGKEKADQARAEREEAEAKERAKAEVEKIKEIVNFVPVEEKTKFTIGDWVKHGGIIGVVGAVDGRVGKLRFLGVRTDEGENSKPYDVGAWVRITDVKHAPLETFDDVNASVMLGEMELKANIDLALATGNKELFMELTDK